MTYTPKEGDCSPTGGRHLVGIDKKGEVIDPLIDQLGTVDHFETIPGAPAIPTTLSCEAGHPGQRDDSYLTDPHAG